MKCSVDCEKKCLRQDKHLCVCQIQSAWMISTQLQCSETGPAEMVGEN